MQNIENETRKERVDIKNGQYITPQNFRQLRINRFLFFFLLFFFFCLFVIFFFLGRGIKHFAKGWRMWEIRTCYWN